MKVFVMCEFSGIVRDAFISRGHDAISCDLDPTEKPGPHLMGDARLIDYSGWDLVIAHPDCTFLTVSGNRWLDDPRYPNRRKDREESLAFVRWVMSLPVPRIAIENPIGVISSQIRKPDQIIQPWQFGHGETKATCLWLKGLPKLTPTNIVDGRDGKCWKESPGPQRKKNRSRTYQGIADAMAEQWGCL